MQLSHDKEPVDKKLETATTYIKQQKRQNHYICVQQSCTNERHTLHGGRRAHYLVVGCVSVVFFRCLWLLLVVVGCCCCCCCCCCRRRRRRRRSGSWLLIVGCWLCLLAFGCRRLAVGCGLLAVGCWLSLSLSSSLLLLLLLCLCWLFLCNTCRTFLPAVSRA